MATLAIGGRVFSFASELSSRPTVDPDRDAPSGNGGSSSGGSAGPPPPGGGTSVWQNPTVIAALIAAITAIIVGYWQFGRPKPPAPDPNAGSHNFRVRVMNYTNQTPIKNARVNIIDGVHVFDGSTGDDGLTDIFTLAKSDVPSLDLTATAAGYSQGTWHPDRPTQDETYTLELQRKRGPSNDAKPNPAAPVQFNFVIDGTWSAHGPGDPKNDRVEEGTFSFVKETKGIANLTGQLRADRMEIIINGKCEWQDVQMHMTYRATNSEGGSWQGSADLTIVAPNKISGRFQSKRGDDIPLVLIKN